MPALPNWLPISALVQAVCRALSPTRWNIGPGTKLSHTLIPLSMGTDRMPAAVLIGFVAGMFMPGLLKKKWA